LIKQVGACQHQAERFIDPDQCAASGAAVGNADAAVGGMVEGRESRVKSRSMVAGLRLGRHHANPLARNGIDKALRLRADGGGQRQREADGKAAHRPALDSRRLTLDFHGTSVKAYL
jgi:hypothetical protein